MSLLTNLVSYWKLDELSGTTAEDAHGSNDGTFVGSPTSAAGKINSGLVFDSSDALNCGSDASLDITGALTIAGWIWPQANSGFGSMIDHAQEGSSIENYCLLITAGTSSPKIWMQWNNGGWQQHSVDNALTTGAWQHIAVTYDAGTVKIYRNGAQIGTTGTGMAALATNASNVCKIARYQVGSQGNFNGLLDEIGLWSRALSDAEISQLYNDGLGLAYPFSVNVNIADSAGIRATESRGISASFALANNANVGCTEVIQAQRLGEMYTPTEFNLPVGRFHYTPIGNRLHYTIAPDGWAPFRQDNAIVDRSFIGTDGTVIIPPPTVPPPVPPPPPPPAPGPGPTPTPVPIPTPYPGPQPTSQIASVNFYIHSDFLATLTESQIRERLRKYVQDVNHIYGKNTNRLFSYEPSANVFIWDGTLPPQVSFDIPLPQGYGFGVYITKNAGGVSVGGSPFRSNVAGSELGSFSYEWYTIWSAADIAAQTPIPGNGEPADSDYYRRQLNALIHEFGHNHGLGFSEYYNLSTLIDNSGVSPNLTLTAATGAYWSARSLIPLKDPMHSPPISAADYLSQVKFSPLSAAVINALAQQTVATACRSMGMPCLQGQLPFTVRVEVLAASNDAPISGASVSMYSLTANSALSGPSETNPAPDATAATDASGIAEFDWGDPLGASMHSKQNQARLFKVQKTGFANNGNWLSVFDVQAKVVGTNATNDFRYPNKLTIKLTAA